MSQTEQNEMPVADMVAELKKGLAIFKVFEKALEVSQGLLGLEKQRDNLTKVIGMKATQLETLNQNIETANAELLKTEAAADKVMLEAQNKAVEMTTAAKKVVEDLGMELTEAEGKLETVKEDLTFHQSKVVEAKDELARTLAEIAEEKAKFAKAAAGVAGTKLSEE